MFISKPENSVSNAAHHSPINSSRDTDDSSLVLFPALLLVILLVVLYGLALWDRWINLSTRELENRPVLYRSHAHYGSITVSRVARNNTYPAEQSESATTSPEFESSEVAKSQHLPNI